MIKSVTVLQFNNVLRMKITGERFYNPPKRLCFQAKGPLLDEPLESLNGERRRSKLINVESVNLSGKRTELISDYFLRPNYIIWSLFLFLGVVFKGKYVEFI